MHALLTRFNKLDTPRLRLVLCLAIALVHGIIYVFMIPPWFHYDEPNHFEYAWLIANRHQLPKPGDYDQEMRRAVAISELQNHFYDTWPSKPDLNPSKGPVYIGPASQLNDPPLYYIVASLPLWIMDRTGGYGAIETQVIAVRLVSLLFYLITIWIAWGLMGELTSPTHPLRWMVPLCMAMLPSFTDIMTAINSDAGAVAFFSLFLWGAIRLVHKGFSWKNIFWAGITAILCAFIKSTTLFAIPLFLIALLLGILHGKWRWLTWGALGLSVIAAVMASLAWGDAAYWYRYTLQEQPTRSLSPQAPVGQYVFQLEYAPGDGRYTNTHLSQVIPGKTVKKLRDHKITIGAYIWASQAVQGTIPTLLLNGGQQQYTKGITISETPTYYTYTVFIPNDTKYIVLSLSPNIKKTDGRVTIYYDGVVLVKGKKPSPESPLFDNSDGTTGTWMGKKFTNILRDASAEKAGLRVRPILDKLGGKVIPDQRRPSELLYSMLDPRIGSPYYQLTFRQLFWTFWAKFGWGETYLSGHKPYRLLGILTFLGLAGIILSIWRWKRTIPWHTILFFSLVMAAVWGLTIVRGPIYIVTRTYLPVARYAYPVIIPSLLALLIGWRAWIPERWWKFETLAILGIFFFYDVYAIVSLISHYYGR